MNRKEDQNILSKAQEILLKGSEVALATVISTWGSSPRPVGSCMIIKKNGEFHGSVSGGCIEAEVIENAIRTIEDKKPRRLDFGVSNDKAWEVGLACGGKISVFIENLE
ncbi:MAG: hypothetical protein CFH01_00340 [Alphaproteobacteria bacterium MarineAlpha2_Bin1]|nr:MAG: hypothetical protein CFH01_00340 [Alphaproteobacteria bacterium MarineAlpha2_Bin1]